MLENLKFMGKVIAGVAAAAGIFGLGVTMGDDADQIEILTNELRTATTELESAKAALETGRQDKAAAEERLSAETARLTTEMDRQRTEHERETAALREEHRAERDELERQLATRQLVAEGNARSDEARACEAEGRQQELLAQMVTILERQSTTCSLPETYRAIAREAEAAVPDEALAAARANLPEGVTLLPRQDCVPSGQTFQLEERKTVLHCESGVLIGNASTLRGQISVRLDGGDRARLEVGSRMALGQTGCSIALLGTNGTSIADLRVDC